MKRDFAGPTEEHPNLRGEVAVAVAIDDRYVPHLATCAASIAASRGPETVRLFVIKGPTLSETSVDRLGGFVRELGLEFEAVPVSEALAASVPATRHYPPIVWHRLLIPGLLTGIDRALVLDADLLVLQSLWPLYSRQLDRFPLAAVGTSTAASDAGRLQELGLDPDAPYLNTGVMLMNLEAMRTERVGARALEWGHLRFRELKFPEQDALNVVLKGEWDILHPRWNAMSHLWLDRRRHDATYADADHESARLSPAVVHFEGHPTAKPWCYRSVHPFRFLYRDLRATTPWPLDDLEGRTLAGAALRRFPLSLQFAVGRARRRLPTRRARGTDSMLGGPRSEGQVGDR